MAIAVRRRREGSPVSSDELRRRETRARLGTFGSHLTLIVIAFVLVAPFYYVIVASFKNQTGLFEYPPKLLPIPPYLGNYEKLLFHTGFLRWMANTLFVATTVTVIKVFLDSMAGYAL